MNRTLLCLNMYDIFKELDKYHGKWLINNYNLSISSLYQNHVNDNKWYIDSMCNFHIERPFDFLINFKEDKITIKNGYDYDKLCYIIKPLLAHTGYNILSSKVLDKHTVMNLPDIESKRDVYYMIFNNERCLDAV